MFSILVLAAGLTLVVCLLLASTDAAEARGAHRHHHRHSAAVAQRVEPARPCFLFECLFQPDTAAPAPRRGAKVVVKRRHVVSRAKAPAPARPPAAAARLPDPIEAVAAGAAAVYDIVAKVITLPSGQRLEAHSGLGAHRDDPRSAHLRMRGPTPPHVYDLTPRERPFHGVAALRLNPVGGSKAIHGRSGLLAHTYMLGSRGDSNGCVSIADYGAFLAAYRRGEFRRLVVVAGG